MHANTVFEKLSNYIIDLYFTENCILKFSSENAHWFYILASW